MTTTQTRNARVLDYFGITAQDETTLSPWDAGPDPYMGAGSHPEIVERLWDQIGPLLPADCRCRVGRNPALAHPRTGLILAVAMGTQYALRLPLRASQLALAAGAKTTTVWGVKNHFDLGATFGTDWVFGAWLKQEPEWCRLVYDAEGAA